MKKKIAIIIPVLAPYTIPRLEELANDENFDIYIFIEKYSFTHRPGWSVSDVKNCKIEIINSFIKKEKVKSKKYEYTIDGIRAIPYRLPKLITKYKPNIILVTNATELIFSYFFKFILKYKIGLIVEDTLHAVKNITFLKQYLKSIIYQRADFYLPFSKDAEDYLNKIGIRSNIFRTSWSIDPKNLNRHFDNEKSLSIRDKFNLNEKITFISVGQLIPRKGFLNLLKAWNELPMHVQNNLALIIIGEGPRKEKMSNFIRICKIPNIYILGHKSYEEMVNYYKAADIFILPTLQDLFSLVVMEAMACGLPVLTTIYNGARELITKGKNGYIFDSADIKDIKKIVIKIYRNKERLREMGNKSGEIIKNYSHELVMKNLRDILLNRI